MTCGMKCGGCAIAVILLAAVGIGGCVAQGIREVEFSTDNKFVAYEKSYVWNPLWPLYIWRASHCVYWRPIEGPDVHECSVSTGTSGNFFLWPPREQNVRFLKFSPDSRHLAVAREDGTILVIDLASYKVWQLDTPKMQHISIAWASNDEIIYSESLPTDTNTASMPAWKQGIGQSAASRAPATLPAETYGPCPFYELQSRLQAADPDQGSRLHSSPSFTISPGAKYVAKVTQHILWESIEVFPAPSPGATGEAQRK